MNTPKIRWYVQDDRHHPVITAEISLGSARYREMHTISQNEVEGLYSISTLWKIIEKMQWNMLDALGYYKAQTKPAEPADYILNPHCYLCLAPLPKLGTVAISYLCSRRKKDVYGTGEME